MLQHGATSSSPSDKVSVCMKNVATGEMIMYIKKELQICRCNNKCQFSGALVWSQFLLMQIKIYINALKYTLRHKDIQFTGYILYLYPPFCQAKMISIKMFLAWRGIVIIYHISNNAMENRLYADMMVWGLKII